MKKYVIQVIIQEGNDEFWEEITKDGASGCDEVVAEVKRCLEEHGFYEDNTQVSLQKYFV